MVWYARLPAAPYWKGLLNFTECFAVEKGLLIFVDLKSAVLAKSAALELSTAALGKATHQSIRYM